MQNDDKKILNEILSKVSEVSTQVKEVSVRVDDLAKRVDEVSDRVDDLAKRVDEVSDRVEKVSDRVDHLAKRIDDVSDRVESVKTELKKEFNAKIESVKTELQNEFRKEIRRLDSRIDFYHEKQGGGGGTGGGGDGFGDDAPAYDMTGDKNVFCLHVRKAIAEPAAAKILAELKRHYPSKAYKKLIVYVPARSYRNVKNALLRVAGGQETLKDAIWQRC